jgi:hypothetical protein
MFYVFREHNAETIKGLRVKLQPPFSGLQNRCSTTEVNWHRKYVATVMPGFKPHSDKTFGHE